MAQATREPQGYPTPDAAQQANDEMWRTFKKQFQEKPITYGTILVLFGFFIGAMLFHHQPDWGDTNNNLFGYLTNFATELLGVVFTIFVVNEFQKRRDRDQLGRELFAAVKYGGPTNVNQALAIMRSYDDELGWYKGKYSLLKDKNLYRTNLESVDLSEANLTESDLRSCKLNNAIFSAAKLIKVQLDESHLRGADLGGANLDKASLDRTILTDANLTGVSIRNGSINFADLTHANLSQADLSNATFFKTNLEGVKLTGANLKGAQFIDCEFSKETILPDDRNFDLEQRSKQLFRYTDSEHPEFWNPCIELEQRPWYCNYQSFLGWLRAKYESRGLLAPFNE